MTKNTWKGKQIKEVEYFYFIWINERKQNEVFDSHVVYLIRQQKWKQPNILKTNIPHFYNINFAFSISFLFYFLQPLRRLLPFYHPFSFKGEEKPIEFTCKNIYIYLSLFSSFLISL